MLNTETFLLGGCPTWEEMIRALKTEYQSNENRFIKRFCEPESKWLQMNDIKNYQDIIQMFHTIWDSVDEYTYKEAFEITDNQLRAFVFSKISIIKMIKELGHKRIQTEGIDLINKTWDPILNKFNEIPMTQIYELHEISGEKLGLQETLYALKCWCTSTNDEHWLFLDKKYTPLEGIASMCKYYSSMEGKIKHIIRQGDVFLFEMTENVLPKESDTILTMNKNNYFKLLKSQS